MGSTCVGFGDRVVPINTRVTSAEIAYIVDDCSAKVSFDDEADLPAASRHGAEATTPRDLAAIHEWNDGLPKGRHVGPRAD